MIFLYQSTVYGGYLRDLILSVEPTDIDAVASIIYRDRMINDLNALYQSEPSFNRNNETLVWRSPGIRPLELFFVEDDPADTIIGPLAAPDFDVNLLAYTPAYGLFNWMEVNSPVEPIIEAIMNREATLIEANQDRLRKLLAKGFTILPRPTRSNPRLEQPAFLEYDDSPQSSPELASYRTSNRLMPRFDLTRHEHQESPSDEEDISDED